MSELYSRHRLRLHAPGERLIFALADAVDGLTRSKARQALMGGLVHCDGAIVDDPGRTLGDEAVQVELDLSQGLKQAAGGGRRPKRPFTMLYEDDQVIVLDKACGVLSAPSKSGEHGHLPELLRSWLQKRGGDAGFIGVVHRIDVDTSGCIVFARNRKAQQSLSVQFKEHGAGRSYRCLCLGQPKQDADTLTMRIGRGIDGRRWIVKDGVPGKDAITHFSVIHRHRHGSDLTVRLETGRTHQIRIHLAAIGCPIVGDPLYGFLPGRKPDLKGLPRANRLMLHAASLAFDHPKTGERIEINAPLPQEMVDFARRLG